MTADASADYSIVVSDQSRLDSADNVTGDVQPSQKDGPRLQHHCHQLQVPVSSRNYRYGLFGSPLPHLLSTFEMDDNSNIVRV